MRYATLGTLLRIVDWSQHEDLNRLHVLWLGGHVLSAQSANATLYHGPRHYAFDLQLPDIHRIHANRTGPAITG